MLAVFRHICRQHGRQRTAGFSSALLTLTCLPARSWVVNLASPIVGVPFHIFLAGMLMGHLPINFISVKVGWAKAFLRI
jgi:hypothetical protein